MVELKSIALTPCWQRSIDSKSVEYGLYEKLIQASPETHTGELSERELKYLPAESFTNLEVEGFPSTIKEIILSLRLEQNKNVDEIPVYVTGH